ncbi:MAG TPA: nuclear transport factor 2 family protein [Streptosporangiaceae bacterium]
MSRVAPGQAERQIRALLDERLAALRSRDASRFAARFDGSIVTFDLAPPLQQAGPVVLDPAGLQSWLDTFRGELSVELTGLRISAGDEVAFCHCLEHITGTRTDGEQLDLWIRSTLGLRQVDGAWRITHEHNSVPIMMDGSQSAALDLRP